MDRVSSNSPLVLEEPELWGTRLHAAKPGAWTVIVIGGSSHLMANGRLVSHGSNRMIQAPQVSRLTNCELLSDLGPDFVFSGDHPRLTIDNCLLAGPRIWL